VDLMKLIYDNLNNFYTI